MNVSWSLLHKDLDYEHSDAKPQQQNSQSSHQYTTPAVAERLWCVFVHPRITTSTFKSTTKYYTVHNYNFQRALAGDENQRGTESRRIADNLDTNEDRSVNNAPSNDRQQPPTALQRVYASNRIAAGWYSITCFDSS